MSALQGWFFLALLGALVARGLDRVRLCREDLPYLGATLGLLLVQRVFADQVTLDEPFVAPILLAIPVIAGARESLRAGLAVALGEWLLVTVFAGTVSVRGSGDFAQEDFIIATLFALGLAGTAGSLRPSRRWLAALLPVGWLGFFIVRDPNLVKVPGIVAISLLAGGWVGLALALLRAPTPEVQP